MLKTLIIGPFIALMLLLSSCNQPNSNLVAEVQAALKQACGFELIASTAAQQIAALFNIPGIATAADVAHAICSQVNANMAAQRRGAVAGQVETVNVRGVTVTGRHVR